MSVAILQHEPVEHAGFLESLWKEQGIRYRTICLYENQEIPALTETHLLIMGGSMSVHDEKEYPFLRQEKSLIREYVKNNRPILGICLGAQLIADALGASVYPFRKEMGWTPITRQYGGPLFPRYFHAFQLHGDTFEIPAGGVLLCRGEEVPHQAFSIRSATGLQFHIEVTPLLIDTWIHDQSEEEQERIRSDTSRYLSASIHLCRRVSDWFLSRNGGIVNLSPDE